MAAPEGPRSWSQNGTPLYNLQEAGGWESESMVRRYSHLAPANLAKHVEVISPLFEGTNPAQSTKTKGQPND